MADRPRVAVFAPNPLVSVTIERRGRDDDIHIHAAGQGVWVARMAAELGATPVLCGFFGGEPGRVLLALRDGLDGDVRPVRTSVPTGSYVVDRRRSVDRSIVAASLATAPSRHEVDDLVAATIATALGSSLLVLCNSYPAVGFPEESYGTLAAAAAAADIPVLVDLSTPRVDHVLPHRPALVKCNDWELAEYVRGPVNGRRALAAARELVDAGAAAVAVTRAERPILVLPSAEARPYEIVPPRLAAGFREGCGDSMMGALAAAWARGLPLRDALVIGAAAGSANFLRHGLGTGKRSVVEELATQIVVRDVAPTPPAPPLTGTSLRALG